MGTHCNNIAITYIRKLGLGKGRNQRSRMVACIDVTKKLRRRKCKKKQRVNLGGIPLAFGWPCENVQFVSFVGWQRTLINVNPLKVNVNATCAPRHVRHVVGTHYYIILHNFVLYLHTEHNTIVPTPTIFSKLYNSQLTWNTAYGLVSLHEQEKI